MLKILVVDDDKDILFIVAFLLEQESFNVMQVADCRNAVAAALDWQPDLIIFDINLGPCDGRHLCHELKTTHNFSAPIILFSANKELSKKIIAYKADDFIEKPFDAAELVSTVQYHLHLI